MTLELSTGPRYPTILLLYSCMSLSLRDASRSVKSRGGMAVGLVGLGWDWGGEEWENRGWDICGIEWD